VAVFGGSFNPVHRGHLLAAKAVLKEKIADEIWFMPCRIHAFKSENQFSSVEHRVKMLKIALKGEKKMKLSTLEIKLGKKRRKNRTIDTVRELKRLYPKTNFMWMIGSNLVNEVPKWAGFNELIREIKIIVVPIKGQNKNAFSAQWLKENKAIVLPQSKATENISSTQIRNRILRGESFSELIPKKVQDFIIDKMLFVPEFRKKVYRTVKRIPKGRVSTYSEIAKALHRKKAARAIGFALKKNPFFPVVPCHRVVLSNGKIGGFSQGVKQKEKLLKSEGLSIKNGKIQNFEKKLMKASELV